VTQVARRTRGHTKSRPSRRRFLKIAGGIAGLLGAGGGVSYWLLFGGRGPGRGRKVLSDGEIRIARAIAEAFFPPGSAFRLDGIQARVAERLDDYLAEVPERERRLIRAGMRAVEYASVLTSGTRFTERPHDERIAVLRAEDENEDFWRHLAMRALKAVFGLLYFEIDEVRAEAGWVLGCTPSRPGPT